MSVPPSTHPVTSVRLTSAIESNFAASRNQTSAWSGEQFFMRPRCSHAWRCQRSAPFLDREVEKGISHAQPCPRCVPARSEAAALLRPAR